MMSPGRGESTHSCLRTPTSDRFEWTPSVATMGRSFPNKCGLRPSCRCAPGGIRNVVCQSLGAQSSYNGNRNEVRNLVASHVPPEDTGPNPMDIGALQGEYAEGDAEEYVGAVG